MHDDFNRYNLVQFINNYTQGFLQRTLRSNNSRRFLQKFKTKINCETKDTRSICIPELTTETFLNTVLDLSKVSLIDKGKCCYSLKNDTLIKVYIKFNAFFLFHRMWL